MADASPRVLLGQPRPHRVRPRHRGRARAHRRRQDAAGGGSPPETWRGASAAPGPPARRAVLGRRTTSSALAARSCATPRRQWIVPGVASLQLQRDPPDGATRAASGDAHTGADMGAEASTSCASSPSPAPCSTSRARLTVKQEAEVAAGGSGLASIALERKARRVSCVAARTPRVQRRDELFETIILPELERAVNEWPEYDVLRAEFARGARGEHAAPAARGLTRQRWKRETRATPRGGSADARGRGSHSKPRASRRLDRGIDATLGDDARGGWTPEASSTGAASAMEGEFHVVRDVENARGDVLRRTYFHGGVDFRRVSFCARGESRAATRRTNPRCARPGDPGLADESETAAVRCTRERTLGDARVRRRGHV